MQTGYKDVEKLKNILDSSKRALVVSHIHPDADAIASSLAVYGLFHLNFPEVKVVINIEGRISSSMSFLQNFEKITNTDLTEKIREFKPDTLILVDCNSLKRVTAGDEKSLQDILKESGIKLVVIDHHTLDSEFSGRDVMINNNLVAGTQEVYEVFVSQLGWKCNKAIAEAILAGIVGDTNRFLFYNAGHRRMFSIVSDLIDYGITVQDISRKVFSFSRSQLKILSELLRNVVIGEKYNYSFLTDDFMHNLKVIDPDISDSLVILAVREFSDNYMESVGDVPMGFVINRMYEGEHKYKVSFRSHFGEIDVSLFARKLGGGGHKSGSSGYIMVNSLDEALNIAKATIEKYYNEAVL